MSWGQFLHPNDTQSPAHTTVTGSAVEILPATQSRAMAWVQLMPASTQSIRIGGASVTTLTGIELQPGQIILWPSAAPLWAIRTAAGVATVGVVSIGQ